MYGYDIGTKAQSSQWKRPEEPRPKKSHEVWSNVKVLLNVFFDCNRVRHHKFLPQCRTVNKEYADCAKQFVRNSQNCRKTNHQLTIPAQYFYYLNKKKKNFFLIIFNYLPKEYSCINLSFTKWLK